MTAFKYFAEEIFRDNNGALPVKDAYQIFNGTSPVILVPAIAGTVIRVISAVFVSGSTDILDIYLASSSDTTVPVVPSRASLGQIYLAPLKSQELPFNPYGWYETTVGDDLVVVGTLMTSVNRGCSIRYIQYVQ